MRKVIAVQALITVLLTEGSLSTQADTKYNDWIPGGGIPVIDK